MKTRLFVGLPNGETYVAKIEYNMQTCLQIRRVPHVTDDTRIKFIPVYNRAADEISIDPYAPRPYRELAVLATAISERGLFDEFIEHKHATRELDIEFFVAQQAGAFAYEYLSGVVAANEALLEYHLIKEEAIKEYEETTRILKAYLRTLAKAAEAVPTT